MGCPFDEDDLRYERMLDIESGRICTPVWLELEYIGSYWLVYYENGESGLVNDKNLKSVECVEQVDSRRWERTARRRWPRYSDKQIDSTRDTLRYFKSKEKKYPQDYREIENLERFLAEYGT